MEHAAALATLARYASAYPGALDGIAERLEHDGKHPDRAKAYRRAAQEIADAIDGARVELGL